MKEDGERERIQKNKKRTARSDRLRAGFCWENQKTDLKLSLIHIYAQRHTTNWGLLKWEESNFET